MASHTHQLLLAGIFPAGVASTVFELRKGPNSDLTILTLSRRARRHEKRGHMTAAQRDVDGAFQLVAAGRAKDLVPLMSLSSSALLAGRTEIGRTCAALGIEVLLDKGYRQTKIALRLYFLAGTACKQLGDYEMAESYFATGLAIADLHTSEKYARQRRVLMENIGFVKIKVADYAGAIQMFERLIDVSALPGDTTHLSNLLGFIASAKFLSGDWEGAEAAQFEANRQRRDRAQRDDSFVAGLIQLAAFEVALGKTDWASAAVAEARAACGEIKFAEQRHKETFHLVDGLLERSRGDNGRAAEHFAAAARIASEGGFDATEKFAEASVWHALALWNSGDGSHLIAATYALRILPPAVLARRARLCTTFAAQETQRGLFREAVGTLSELALTDLALHGRLTETAVDACNYNRSAIANADPAEATWLDSIFEWAGGWRE